MPATRPHPALSRTAAAAALLITAASAPSTAPDEAPCERHLRPAHTYHAGHHTFTTDRLGRPIDALARTLTTKTASRGECESTVGDWGGRGDWQGGHLIAASFGGVSRRYNLAPVRGRQINQGLMKRVENGARSCLEGDGAVSAYRVRLRYPDQETITPDRIHMTMSPKISGVSREVALTLPNESLSASDLDRWEGRITKAFEAAGCGMDGLQGRYRSLADHRP
ncbi:DNA/RNA non-specific endonuclease [Nonomuraea sp. K274]|uniref:DNA/RNA non-specific endonuclease n=1 Tax=Nonomuraea cypriaca TaxID=1187855 RepID=A0A931AJL9_9ACTN|nr:DNA/RNA non-specific endonuclease [Nonomuraea cypriaca]MBF8190262.1 DNA/RNA non-specific endonuclease [Nonomuraea cypriaca]